MLLKIYLKSIAFLIIVGLVSCKQSNNTPNIDQLANNGLRLTQFYNAARCCPSKDSLLKGLYPHQAGLGHQNQDKGHPSYRGEITNNAILNAKALIDTRYATYHVGMSVSTCQKMNQLEK